MIIYEDTNILVSGAFLKCFSIFLSYNPLSFSVSIITFLIRHFLVILTLSDYSGTLCTTLDQPFTCGGGQGCTRSPSPAPSYPAPRPLYPRFPPPLTRSPPPLPPLPAPSYSLPAPRSPPLLPRFQPPLPRFPPPLPPSLNPLPASLPPLPVPFTSYPRPPSPPALFLLNT